MTMRQSSSFNGQGQGYWYDRRVLLLRLRGENVGVAPDSRFCGTCASPLVFRTEPSKVSAGVLNFFALIVVN
jgi:hypothetical protein